MIESTTTKKLVEAEVELRFLEPAPAEHVVRVLPVLRLTSRSRRRTNSPRAAVAYCSAENDISARRKRASTTYVAVRDTRRSAGRGTFRADVVANDVVSPRQLIDDLVEVLRRPVVSADPRRAQWPPDTAPLRRRRRALRRPASRGRRGVCQPPGFRAHPAPRRKRGDTRP